MHGLRSVTEKILLFIDCIGNFGGTGTSTAAAEPRRRAAAIAHHIPGWWSSPRATAPALYYIAPGSRAVRYEYQHAGDVADGGIATPNTPGPVFPSVEPFSQRSCPQWDLPTAVWLSSAAHYPRSSFSGGILEHIKSARSARFGLMLEHSG